MLTEFWTDTALPALLSVLTVALTVATTVAIGALRRWGAAQEAAWMKTAIDAAADAVETAVHATNQTLVDELRELSADGRLTAQEARVALDRAITVARRQIGDAGLAALSKALGGNAQVDAVLTGMVEATVSETKEARLGADTERLVALNDHLSSEMDRLQAEMEASV